MALLSFFNDEVTGNSEKYQRAILGHNQHVYINSGGGDTATSYFCFVPTAEAVVTYTDVSGGGNTTHTSKSIPAGMYVFGNFTSISVASGTIIAYINEA